MGGIDRVYSLCYPADPQSKGKYLLSEGQEKDSKEVLFTVSNYKVRFVKTKSTVVGLNVKARYHDLIYASIVVKTLNVKRK